MATSVKHILNGRVSATKQQLTGRIVGKEQPLMGCITDKDGPIIGRMNSSGSIDGVVNITTESPVYDGELTVIPSTNDTILPTAQKLVMDNVRVEKIPYSEVSNTSNGITVTIG